MARTSVAELRRQILDTTRKLLVAEGYQNLSMRKIANTIGYSATSIYLHFENKDHLVHTLIEEGMDQLFNVLNYVQTHTADPLDRLKALCENYIAFGLDNPEYYEIMFQLHPARMERFPVDKFRRARRNLETFTNALKEGTEKGIFYVNDYALATHFIWSALHGAVSLMLAHRIDSHVDWNDLKHKVVRQVSEVWKMPYA